MSHDFLRGNRTPMLRPAVMGRQGMVASAHPLASGAGVDVLKAGGNAFDAAVAVNAVLNVTQPHMCGIGGDVFYLLYRPREKRVAFLNGSGRSGARATLDFYRSRGHGSIPLRGALSMVTVPGCVDAWHEMLARYGTMAFSDLLAPAIRYAEAGHPVSHHLSEWIKGSPFLSHYPTSAGIFLRNGRPPEPGELLIQTDLARSFRAVAAEGRDAFYHGDIAEAIAAWCRQNGGILSKEDFAAHHSDWGDPIRTDYRDHTIYETPPNTQGIAALLEFNIVEGVDVGAMGHNSAEHLHLLCEAKKLAYADRDRHVTDPTFHDIPVERLLDKAYAAGRRSLIDPGRALSGPGEGNDPRGDTTYFAVVDGEGNIVSCIQSLYFLFGSGVVAGDTGIVMQNRGAYFSMNPDHPNRLEPGKRTMHTLMASLVFDREKRPVLVFGTMGGDGQPQTHLSVISNILDFGMNIQQAIESPRWIHGNVTIEEPRVRFNIEGRVSGRVIEQLRHMGHDVNVMEDWTWNVGHAQGILIRSETGVLQGGADPRGDGYALGW